MKRRISLCIAIALLLGLCTIAAAERSFGGGGMDTNTRVLNVLPWGSDLLAYTSDNTLSKAWLYDGIMGTQTPTVIIDGQSYAHRIPAFVQFWAGPGGSFYGAMLKNGAYVLYYGAPESGNDITLTSVGDIPLPWKVDQHAPNFLCRGSDIVAQHGSDLFSWNPDTGATAFWPGCKVSEVFASGEKLLGVCDLELVQLDITGQSVSPVMKFDKKPEQIAGSPDGRMTAWLNDSIITCKGDGVADRGGYMDLTLDDYRRPACLTNTGLFAVIVDGRVYYKALSPSFDPANLGLRVSDCTGQAGSTERFLKAHPGARVTPWSSENWDDHLPSALAERIRTGDKSIDIFLFHTDEIGYRTMMAKGFCADLSDDPEISAMVAAMPESLSAALMTDGKICAVPYDGRISPFSVHFVADDALEEMGLALEDIPPSMDELMDALLRWLGEGRFDSVRLSDSTEDHDWTWPYAMALGLYTTFNTLDQKYTAYDSPALREMMTKCERVMQLLRRRPWPGNDAPALFHQNWFNDFSHHGINPPEGTAMITLVPFADDDPRVICSLDVAVLNPLSERKEEALVYLRSAMADLPPTMALYFWPDQAVPVRDNTFSSSIDTWENELARWEARAADESLPEDERRKAREEVEWCNDYLEGIRQDLWLLSQETIDAYRAMLPNIAVSTSDLYLVLYRSGILDAEKRFDAGQMTMDAFLKTYDRIARMIALEDGVLN